MTVGPYARLAVRQAARDASDLTTPYRLAALIHDPESRAEFLRAAPQDVGHGFHGPLQGGGVRLPPMGR